MPMGLPSNAVHHDDAAGDRRRRDREPLEVAFVAKEPSRSNDRDGNQHANHE